MSGLTRSDTRIGRPSRAATAPRRSISSSLSALTCPTPVATASSSSASLFPTPAKTMRSGGNPARIAATELHPGHDVGPRSPSGQETQAARRWRSPSAHSRSDAGFPRRPDRRPRTPPRRTPRCKGTGACRIVPPHRGGRRRHRAARLRFVQSPFALPDLRWPFDGGAVALGASGGERPPRPAIIVHWRDPTGQVAGLIKNQPIGRNIQAIDFQRPNTLAAAQHPFVSISVRSYFNISYKNYHTMGLGVVPRHAVC